MTTSTSALSVVSDRWRDQAILKGTVANLDAVNLLRFTLPPGFGDCLLLEVLVQVEAIDVLFTPLADMFSGPRVTLMNDAETVDLDFVGVAPWIRVDQSANAIAIAADVDPDEIVFWRESERLQVYCGEIDVDATPLGDFTVLIRVQRLRVSQPQAQAEFLLVS